MKRTLATFVATVAGLVVLLNFKTISARRAASPPVGNLPNSTSGASSPSVSPLPAGPTPSGGAAAPTPSVAAPAATRIVTGKSVATRYGDVEIQVTLIGNRISAVTAIKLPDSNGVDQQIDQQVVPILVQETIAAQSATIAMVSGATYTSDGYIRSLQSALDKAKL